MHQQVSVQQSFVQQSFVQQSFAQQSFAQQSFAQQFFATMRTSLRTDLTPEAIAAEALGASKRIAVGKKDESIALRVVAEALASVGRTDEARAQLGLAIKAAKRAPSSTMVGSCLALYARLHGSAKAMDFLDQISDRESWHGRRGVLTGTPSARPPRGRNRGQGGSRAVVGEVEARGMTRRG